jgi:fatty-acyl-CoA synthase
VAEAINVFPGVLESNVYGVSVPGAEGRAGMAALVLDDTFDMATFHRHVTDRIPAYARPVFLRIQEAIETTSTFKPRKVDLVKQGFDPGATTDRIYFLDPRMQAYRPLDPSLYREICHGKVKL